jgi:hypothetical protein
VCNIDINARKVATYNWDQTITIESHDDVTPLPQATVAVTADDSKREKIQGTMNFKSASATTGRSATLQTSRRRNVQMMQNLNVSSTRMVVSCSAKAATCSLNMLANQQYKITSNRQNMANIQVAQNRRSKQP